VAKNTAPTSVDLSAAIGKFVRYKINTRQLEVNTSAGTASLGVLTRIYSQGGNQWGEFYDGPDEVKIVAGAALVVGDSVTPDASGRAVKAVGADVVAGVMNQAASAANALAYMSPFQTTTTLGGGSVGAIYAGTGALTNGSGVIAPGAYAITATSVIHATRTGNPATALGDLTIVSQTTGAPGVATFTVEARGAAAGVIVAADQSTFGWTIIG